VTAGIRWDSEVGEKSHTERGESRDEWDYVNMWSLMIGGVGRHPQRRRGHVLNMNRFLVYSFDRENGEFTSKKRALTHKYNRL
jgi:hypothetical protein